LSVARRDDFRNWLDYKYGWSHASQQEFARGIYMYFTGLRELPPQLPFEITYDTPAFCITEQALLLW